MRLLGGSSTSGGGSLTSSSGGSQGFGALGSVTGGARRGALAMLLSPIVVGLLEHHSEIGDAQTCFAFARVVELAFGPSAPPRGSGAGPGAPMADPAEDEDTNSLVPVQERTRWLHAYVEQLYRLRQFVSACYIVKSSDDELLRTAWKNIGHYYASRQRWSKAVQYFTSAKDPEALVECYYRLEEYQLLEKLVRVIPEGSPLLMDIGNKFQAVGRSESASMAFLKAGDVKAAIDCCVLLNCWDKAVQVSGAKVD